MNIYFSAQQRIFVVVQINMQSKLKKTANTQNMVRVSCVRSLHPDLSATMRTCFEKKHGSKHFTLTSFIHSVTVTGQLPKPRTELPKMTWQTCGLANLTFRGPCIVIYSYNESQRDALFLRFIWQSTLHVSDKSTVHHREYLNTVYTQ
jgi:hypothetical protein